MKFPSFRRTSRSSKSDSSGNSEREAQEVKNAEAQEVRNTAKVSLKMTRSPTKDTLVSGSTTFSSTISLESTNSLTGLVPMDDAIDPRCRSSTLRLTEKRLAEKFQAEHLASLEGTSCKTGSPSASWGHWDGPTRRGFDGPSGPRHIGDTVVEVEENIFSVLVCDGFAAKGLKEFEGSKLSQFCWTGNLFPCKVVK